MLSLDVKNMYTTETVLRADPPTITVLQEMPQIMESNKKMGKNEFRMSKICNGNSEQTVNSMFQRKENSPQNNFFEKEGHNCLKNFQRSRICCNLQHFSKALKNVAAGMRNIHSHTGLFERKQG